MIYYCTQCGVELFKGVNWIENNKLPVAKRKLCKECLKRCDKPSPTYLSKAAAAKKINELERKIAVLEKENRGAVAMMFEQDKEIDRLKAKLEQTT